MIRASGLFGSSQPLGDPFPELNKLACGKWIFNPQSAIAFTSNAVVDIRQHIPDYQTVFQCSPMLFKDELSFAIRFV